MLRMPDGMRDRLKESAKRNGRSMNAEIVSKLERYDSLGGEVDAMWEVARALAAEIDEVSGPDYPSGPLVDRINDAFQAVDEFGNVDRARLGREFAEEAHERLGGVLEGELGLPAELLARVQLASEKKGRSLSAEVIRLIEDGFEQRAHFEWLEDQHRAHEDDIESTERMVAEYERNQERVLATNSTDVSVQLQRLEHKIESLTKGLAIYGRAFTISMEGDADRTLDMLDMALEEVQAKDNKAKGLMPPQTRPTPEEWEILRAAPKGRQPEILEALANVEVDRALEIARQPVSKKKGAA